MENDDRDHSETAKEFFEILIALCSVADLPPNIKAAVLGKVLVLTCLENVSKEQFMKHIGYIYDFESLLKPDQMEIH